MNLGESYANRMEWVTKNIKNNLDFLPDDKLNWKPSESANSALEIMDHLVMVIELQTAAIRGDENAKRPTYNFQSRDEAKNSLQKAADEYSKLAPTLSESDWNSEVKTPFGTFPKAMLGEIAVADAMHHHGQIVYIQTILGDTESHLLQ